MAFSDLACCTSHELGDAVCLSSSIGLPVGSVCSFLVVGWLVNWSRGNAQVRSALFFCIGMGAKLKEENPMTLFVGIMRKTSNRSKDGVLIITSFED